MSVNQNPSDDEPKNNPQQNPRTNKGGQHQGTVTKSRVTLATIFGALGAGFGGWGGFLVNLDHKLAKTSLVLFWIGTIFTALCLRLILRNLNKTKGVYNGWCWGSIIPSTVMFVFAFVWLARMSPEPKPVVESTAHFRVGIQIAGDDRTTIELTNSISIEASNSFNLWSADPVLVVPINAGQTNKTFILLVTDDSWIDAEDVETSVIIPKSVVAVAEFGWTESAAPFNFVYPQETGSNIVENIKSATWKIPAILGGNTEVSPAIGISTEPYEYLWMPIGIVIRAKHTTPLLASFRIQFWEFPTNRFIKPFWSEIKLTEQGKEWISVIPPTNR